MPRLELEAMWNSLHKMENQLGTKWADSVDSKEVNVIYNVATDDCLELITHYMLNELMEERLEIEYTNTKKLKKLEVIFGNDMHNSVKRCITKTAEENFKLGFSTAFKMLMIAENYKDLKSADIS